MANKGAQCTMSNLAYEIHKPFFTSNISDKQDFIGCSCDKTKTKPNKDSFLFWRMPLMNETGPNYIQRHQITRYYYTRFRDWFVRYTLVPGSTDFWYSSLFWSCGANYSKFLKELERRQFIFYPADTKREMNGIFTFSLSLMPKFPFLEKKQRS